MPWFSNGTFSFTGLSREAIFLSAVDIVAILCRCRTRWIFSVVPFTYGKIAIFFSLSSSRSFSLRFSCNVLCIVVLLYPLFCKMSSKFFSSAVRCSSSVRFFDLYARLLMTERNWEGWWWEFAFRYLLVCVAFRNTVWASCPFSFLMTSTSRKLNFPSLSVSIVNWILEFIALRWLRKCYSFSLPWLHITKVSST